jgi:putative ABC transport system substrate-binding protein
MRADALEFVNMPVDVLVASSTPLIGILKPLTQTIPIIFAQVADPIVSGYVTSYARPTGNITGFTDFDTSIGGKWLEILKEAAPFVSRVTVLADPKQSNHQAFLNVIEATARLLKIQASASCSAQVLQTSTCSAIASASSISMPRYRTVLSILVCLARAELPSGCPSVGRSA